MSQDSARPPTGPTSTLAEYELVIGLEVHVQLKTATKLFCACPVTFGEPPNSAVCPVCLGLPGALPVVNERAFELSVMAALALDCEIAAECRFDRKSYFYPDLPKSYQISQYDHPLATGGRVTVDLDEGTKEVPLERLHLEEDAGRLFHDEGGGPCRIDYNRAGTPLIEIVSAPELRSPSEASQFLREVRRMLRALGVSDCEMERGSLRVDCNVSVRAHGDETLGTYAEIKNLNSFKAVERAAAFEGERQWARLQDGKAIAPETRLWEEETERTRPMRAKESMAEYRYFPEPDLPPLRVERDFLAQVRGQLAELPRARRERFVRQHGLPAADARTLAQTRGVADYYEDAVKAATQADAKAVANMLCQSVLRFLNETGTAIEDYPVGARQLAELIDLVAAGRLNRPMSRKALRQMIETGCSAEEAADAMGERITADDELGSLCRQAIDENPKPAESYRKGKTTALQSLVGWVMQASRGKADARRAAELLEDLLDVEDAGGAA